MDIRVALSSAAKTTAFKGRRGLSAAASELGAMPPPHSKIKALGRRIARLCYRVIKPVARPIALRLRAHFTSILRQELQQAQHQTSRELEQYARRQHQSTERLLATHTAAILQALKSSRKVKPSETQALLTRFDEQARGMQLLMQKILAPGDTFVDVSTGVGAYALAAHLALGGRGRIVTFEPSSSIHEPTREPLRIDDILEVGACADLIRIDARGVGLHVLEGASKAIAANQNIALIVEFDSSNLDKAGASSEDWRSYFGNRGFQHAVIDPASGMLWDASTQAQERMASTSLLFARPGAFAWARALGAK